MRRLTVIIPFYKDLSGLLNTLKHNKKFLSDFKIIIVNDSPEVSLDEAEKVSRNITVIVNKKNCGFGQSVNRGVSESKTEFVMLLNSDVLLNDSSFEKAFTLFDNDTLLFAVSFAQKERDGKIVGANEGYFENGLFHHRGIQSEVTCEVLWPEGGSCIVRREMFNRLDGFDKIYSPFYWEDVDLGFRARKAGFHNIYYPAILVEHHHETTISSYFSRQEIGIIANRNQFIFIWKNIRGKNLIEHIVKLPVLLWSQRKNRQFIVGFKQALSRYLTNL
ncbi:MAG: glycosyltransferase [Patescibacteria group bacterium]|jgi:GT2 family glycosyltransferase